MKRIITWEYERASWQWDLLCLVILVFIFATPKEWFNKPNALATKNAGAIVQPKVAASAVSK